MEDLKEEIKKSKNMINFYRILLDSSISGGDYYKIAGMEKIIRRQGIDALCLEGLYYINTTLKELLKYFEEENASNIVSGMFKSLNFKKANKEYPYIEFSYTEDTDRYEEHNGRRLDDIKIFMRDYIKRWKEYNALWKN